MKVKNSKLLEFNQLVIRNKKLPAKLGYAIAVNTTAVKGAIETFFEQRKNKIEEYANKDEKGKIIINDDSYSIPEENREALNNELKELLEMEVEVPITTVSFETIEKCDCEKFEPLTSSELMALQFMIKD